MLHGHGAHVLRGIEVYDGAPIFYSLGDFVMENETVTRLPTELYDRYDLPAGRYRESVIAALESLEEDAEPAEAEADAGAGA